ncbi:MAG: flagellar assembly protein FliW [Synergistales bacterium]|nr:flagellar assembly protein FliW [Synergistales bacterium]
MMELKTTRFGTLTLREQDIITFEKGVPGFPTYKKWLLVGDENSPIQWFQSTDDPDVALPVTSPGLFFGSYNAKIAPSERQAIGDPPDEHLSLVVVLTIPAAEPWKMTANLRAPIIINQSNRKARQTAVLDDSYQIRQPVFSPEAQEKLKAQAQNEETQEEQTVKENG